MQRMAAITIVLCPIAVLANVSIYSFLNLPKAGAGETILLVLLILALLTSIYLFEMVRGRRERMVEKSVTEERFIENGRRFSLDKSELQLLREMARYQAGADPNDIFESLTVFEQCVEQIVAEHLLAAAGDTSRHEAEDLLQAIRKKLHFATIDQGMPLVSTRNISTGQNVWILGPKKMILGEAIVTSVRELSFSVKLAKDFSRQATFASPIRMAFTRKADGIYGIEVPLVSFEASSGVVTCRHTIKFKRNQLRQDVRVETDLTISIRRTASETAAKGAATDQSSTMVTMVDLSGGGLAFVTDRKFENGDTIQVTASSPKLTIAGVNAKILAYTQNRISKRIMYHAQFFSLDPEKKDAIVKYVFVRLRELNQR